MSGRTVPFINGSYYHVYNRGSDKRNIYLKNREYKRFVQTFYYYQFLGPKPRFSKFAKSSLNSFNLDINRKLVDVLCYCLMPNHFHFLIKQLRENGISTFLSQVSNSYTKYFNTKYKRVGPLLQGVFKSVLIETDEQLIHTSRYIHLNPIVSGITRELNTYPWSSLSEYTNKNGDICNIDEILSFFKQGNYQEFVKTQIDYGTSLEILKHKTIDTDE